MLWHLDPAAPTPLFEQVGLLVKEAVAAGTLRSGDRLPSVRELAKELTINPNTVVRAYAALEHDGVIVRRQGAGSFISDQSSPLRDEERRRRLTQLARRTATEAFHLGFGAEEIAAAVRAELERVRFPDGPKPARSSSQECPKSPREVEQ